MTAPDQVAEAETAADTPAEDYWRAACLLSFSHAVGLSWPPPGEPQRSRAVGHWGCNPGIAWIAGHLAATCAAPEFLLIVGTGHAGSFTFAHEALRDRAGAALLSRRIREHGSAGGWPTEDVGAVDVPYLGGELGPALGVGQGIAAARPGLPVVTVVGDGECETPVALAALAHRDVLLHPRDGTVWLPVVNVNGARMGSAARFSAERLHRLLSGFGYTVVSSGPTAPAAAVAARRAWELAGRGEPVVWLSVTEKGWPAPPGIDGGSFRGPRAHKPASLDPAAVGTRGWLTDLNTPEVVGRDGRALPEITALARRIRLDLPSSPSPSRTVGPTAAEVRGGSPIGAVDQVVQERGLRVFSPDEASSNRLDGALAAGLVTEVLAEELCSAWTWGFVEAGAPAVVVSYEAFAPLMSTQLAQYLKVLDRRPAAGRPAYLVVLTSLGWANSPTHQNTDAMAALLARPTSPARVVLPVGASSARSRFEALTELRDHVGLLVCSKQSLPELPDPGGAGLLVTVAEEHADAARHDGMIIAAGDIAVAEAVAAMLLATAHGVRLRVVALVDLTAAARCGERSLRATCAEPVPAVCACWTAAPHLAAVYQQVRPQPTPAVGYREQWGATPWETLAANGLTRWGLLQRLAEAGCPLPVELLASASECVPGARPAGSADLEVRPLC